MSESDGPHLDERRAAAFSAELRARARAWLPSWGLADAEGDFGRALLDVAARFNAEVAERLDRGGEKMRRGFLDWLGVRAEAARPARMPVVFKLADAARDTVLAEAPVRLQADAGGASVVFETEAPVRIVPGRLQLMVGTEGDALYMTPPGLSDLQPLEPVPTQWELKSFASAGARKIQLDPETGLADGMIVEAGGAEYRIVHAENGIVTIDPALDADLAPPSTVRVVSSFAPFDGAARNRQEHALYLGHLDVLNVEAAATIDVVGARQLTSDVRWEYWGKVAGGEEDGWQPLSLASPQAQLDAPDAVVLVKKKGAIAPRVIGGNNSRWIRAYATSVTDGMARLEVDTLALRVNCQRSPASCPPDDTSGAAPVAEAMANTTPIVLDNVFFPLGKQPRQFDAFYLGSQEAFSKHGAAAQLCFEMADPTFFALSAVRAGYFANRAIAGVAKDRALHLFGFSASGTMEKLNQREPLQPPLPGYEGRADSSPTVALDQPLRPIGSIGAMRSRWRLPVWSEDDSGFPFPFPGVGGFLVGVSAGDAIWAWHEKPFDRNRSGWISFGSIPATTPPAAETSPVAGLVYLGAPGVPQLFALRNHQLVTRSFADGQQWTPVVTKDSAQPVPPAKIVALESIVPVLDEAAGMVSSLARGMVGVSADNKLYKVSATGLCTELSPTNVDFGVRPVAVQTAGGLVIALAKKSRRDLVSYHEVHGEAAIQLKEADAEVIGFEAVPAAAGVQFLASVTQDAGDFLASWAVQTSPVATIAYGSAAVPASAGSLGGAPTEIAQHVVIPGTRADVVVAPIDPSRRPSLTGDLEAAFVMPASGPVFQAGDVVTAKGGPTFEVRQVKEQGPTKDGETVYSLDAAFGAASIGALYGFHSTGPGMTGVVSVTSGTGTIELDGADHTTVEGALLLFDSKIYAVTSIAPATPTTKRVATLADTPPTGIPSATYWGAVPINGSLAPLLQLDSANNDWDASLLDHASLLFAGADPEIQKGKAISVASGNRPLQIVLGADWMTPPASLTAAPFVIDAVVGEWTRLLGDTATNPELSWEYWNGTGWWRLPVTLDDTLNLKSSGALRFDVPPDIAASDWAGKTNFWIRARLVGGDYGQEKVTVTTKDLGGGVTSQTVDRSSEGIRAPSVVRLSISYRVCTDTLPTFVLAQDSGSIRDQSDANRTGGALVTAFVPLPVALGRLTGASPATEQGEACPPPCGCGGSESAAGVRAASSSASSATVVAPSLANGRALFIGFDAALSGAPVNVLLLVAQERNHAAFAPLIIEALVADRFIPIVAKDETRGLGESGLLTLSFTLPPTRRELFGESLTWLRLAPAANGATGEWKPSIRGAYLNGVWASATETLTRELLGSSEGAPGLTVELARPPVLRRTLELRVREPLGDEERAALQVGDERRVLSTVEGLPGDWVRWTQVDDPSDEAPNARVYSLDEATGVVTFGDGLHGMIPPIGIDSIVAFSYQRTEPPVPGDDRVPANLVFARAPLNLVSPVESVETVTAADQAAGGAPPEPTDRVLRFGFARVRHRHRAVTARDFEDLALESSPDIAQAHCIVRPRRVRLVVVMRGSAPIPTSAQTRELHRLLLDAAPAALRAPGALRIEAPVIRRLRVELRLRVDALEQAGTLADDVTRRLAELFDAATGGVSHAGWPLGASPTEDDVALALLDAPHLDGIVTVRLLEHDADGERPWPSAIRSTTLVVLDADAVRIVFEPDEALV